MLLGDIEIPVKRRDLKALAFSHVRALARRFLDLAHAGQEDEDVAFVVAVADPLPDDSGDLGERGCGGTAGVRSGGWRR